MTTVYLIRHSKPLKVNNTNTKDVLQLCNEKQILSLEGEEIAKQKLNRKELEGLDCILSSNYVRAISTAKYIAAKNDLAINIIDEFGERKFGINSYAELPEDFEIKQFNDENYKLENGESQKEVQTRMYNALLTVLDNYKNKKICIVSHSTAICYLLKKWCDVSYSDNYKFNDKIFFNGIWNYCETFKLEFDDNNNLISIINLENE